METNTVNCPACNAPNACSASDELIRCRSCGANIHVDKVAAKPAADEGPRIQVPENEPVMSVQASISQRLLTYIVDQFVTAMVFLLLLTAGGGDAQTPDLSFYIAFMTVPFYYILLEGSNGKTLGKLVAGTRVVDANGHAIGYGTAFIRTLCRMIPLEVFSIFFHNGRCWHDLISRTYAINER